MDLIKRCCVCKRTEEPVKENGYFSDGYLSRECYKNFCEEQGDKNGLKIINKLRFPHENCIDLYGPVS